MGRLLRFIAATAIVILAVSTRTVRGFECYCNSYYDSSCVGQKNTITCPDDPDLACEISIQFNPAVGNFTHQGCVVGFIHVLGCAERLIENPVGSVPYRYCCKEELCNSEEALQQLIAGSEPSSPITSSSHHYEASVSSLNPTGTTSQAVTMPTVSEPTSVATELTSREESSTQYEATTSDTQNGVQATSSLIVPVSTPFTANPTTAVTTEVPSQGDRKLSCVCNSAFDQQGCADDPSFCSISAEFAHCTIEVGSDMQVINQGCYDLFTSYLTCVGKVTENGAGRFVMCCDTDNCNTKEALLQKLNSAGGVSTSSTILPLSSPVRVVEPPTVTSLIPTNSTTIVGDSLTGPPAYAIALITILAFILLVFIIIIVVVTMLHFFPRHVVGIAIPTESDGTPTISTESVDFSNDHIQDMIGTTSGSGSGMPLLIQRSIATQVTLEHLIGKGKFGEVWKGGYKGDDIAVKIFHTREQASFFHEVDIYSTCLIRHPNIVRFVAADNKDIGMATQLWLITEYCSNGSLYELLLVEALDEATMLKLLHTTVSGIAHLHQEITGTEGKPAIAHRDIKSRNILVKADYTCCIADLGLAIRYNKTTDTVEEPPTKRVGTRRYLSPEILNDTINVHNFDCFKRSDMYSFGLVMWETARRGECAGHVEDYQLPYFDLVPSDPSFEDMKKVVVDDLRRPGIPNRWHQSELFHGLSKIIEQCWHHNGEARVTALRVKKNLHNLHSMLGKNKMSSMTKLNQASLSKINVTSASK